jgi:hypothetical protein
MITTGPLNLSDLDQPYVCVVQLITQPPGVLQQVTIRPDKTKDGLIRLGETMADEANCWIYPQNINIIVILGAGEERENQDEIKPHLRVWDVTPLVTDTEKTNALS